MDANPASAGFFVFVSGSSVLPIPPFRPTKKKSKKQDPSPAAAGSDDKNRGLGRWPKGRLIGPDCRLFQRSASAWAEFLQIHFKLLQTPSATALRSKRTVVGAPMNRMVRPTARCPWAEAEVSSGPILWPKSRQGWGTRGNSDRPCSCRPTSGESCRRSLMPNQKQSSKRNSNACRQSDSNELARSAEAHGFARRFLPAPGARLHQPAGRFFREFRSARRGIVQIDIQHDVARRRATMEAGTPIPISSSTLERSCWPTTFAGPSRLFQT